MPLFLCSDQVTDVLLSYLTLQQNQTNGSFKVSLTQCISLVNVHYVCTRVIFYVRRIGMYLYKYRIYGTITIYFLKGLVPVYHLIHV